MPIVRSLVENDRVNAALAWLIVSAIVVAAAATAWQESLLWASLGASIVVLALVPPIVRRDPSSVPPWEVLLIAAVPIWVRLYGTLPIAGFLTVAAIALLVTAEIDAFTPIRMSPRFVVAFVVLATMAVAGLWTIGQWVSDVVFATSFLTTKNELMWDLVYATAFGGLAGVLFVVYFYRHDTAGGEHHSQLGDSS
ncbi:hypothetical protein [Saliphagus infecundisoli]|uniref:Uncharacterized protein n=1 Tax=Saliphagus infecundisoli TaxID=1849069 RepID=A0ABD5QGC6_9EURY|nr:hypothetical protein [Saliphagus infecundisoli]